MVWQRAVQLTRCQAAPAAPGQVEWVHGVSSFLRTWVTSDAQARACAQSAFKPAVAITPCHFWRSLLPKVCSHSGVPPAGSKPSSSRRWRVSGRCSALLNAVLSVWMMAGGVPLGA
ncbi:hypothetical protein D3C71_1718300 [compost metagenome]